MVALWVVVAAVVVVLVMVMEVVAAVVDRGGPLAREKESGPGQGTTFVCVCSPGVPRFYVVRLSGRRMDKCVGGGMLLPQAGGAQAVGLSVGAGVRSVPTRLVVPGVGVGVGVGLASSILAGAARLLGGVVPGPVYGRLGSV